MLARLLDSPKKRIIAAFVAVVVLGGAVIVATSGADDEAGPGPTTTTTTEAPTTTLPQPVAPLTGLPGDYGDRLGQPAVVVKIDNGEPKARPQLGLNEADIVYEERVEGAVTRLLAIFHSTDAGPVGPVRSARTSDIAIVSALNRPYFVWSGANATFASRIRASNIKDVGYDVLSGEYFREPSRSAPSNLMVRSTATLRTIASEGSTPPPALVQYRARGRETTHLEDVTGVHIEYGSSGGSAPVDYRWDGSGWARFQKGTPHVDAAGRQVAPANVIIQFVAYTPTDVTDQFGDPIPEAQLVGEGDVWILTGGGLSRPGLVQGRWKKDSLEAVATYTDVDGNPILLTPGRTWVALPPPGGASRL